MKKVVLLCMLMFVLVGCAPVELNSVDNRGDIIIFKYSDGHEMHEVSNYKTVEYKQEYIAFSRIGSNHHYQLFFNMTETGIVYTAEVTKELYDSTIPGEGLFCKYKYTIKGDDENKIELISFEIDPNEGKVPLPIDVD